MEHNSECEQLFRELEMAEMSGDVRLYERLLALGLYECEFCGIL